VDSSQGRKGPSRTFVSAAVAVFLAATPLAACSDEPDQTVHCVSEDGTVVDPSLCDESHYTGGGVYPYWLWMSPTPYPVGQRVPADWQGSRISPTDTTARANAGLPPKGSVGGTTVRGGGFGSGGGHGTAGG
jgi:hypothetical protein